MTLTNWWRWAIYSRPFLLFALVCNILGTIYGYIWYGSQLKQHHGISKFSYLIVLQLLYFYVLL